MIDGSLFFLGGLWVGGGGGLTGSFLSSQLFFLPRFFSPHRNSLMGTRHAGHVSAHVSIIPPLKITEIQHDGSSSFRWNAMLKSSDWSLRDNVFIYLAFLFIVQPGNMSHSECATSTPATRAELRSLHKYTVFSK